MAVLLFETIPSAVSASPTETFVFLSEGEVRRLDVGQVIVEEIKSKSDAGDFFHVVSTPTHEHIVSLEVPDGTKEARLKRRDLVKGLFKLQSWLQQGSLSDSRQLKVYGLPETLANLRKHPDSECRVVLVGSPIFLDKHYAGLNMVDQKGNLFVPMDGWLIAGADSPFAPRLCCLPEGTVVTWITASSLWGPTPSIEHRQAVRLEPLLTRREIQEVSASKNRCFVVVSDGRFEEPIPTDTYFTESLEQHLESRVTPWPDSPSLASNRIPDAEPIAQGSRSKRPAWLLAHQSENKSQVHAERIARFETLLRKLQDEVLPHKPE